MARVIIDTDPGVDDVLAMLLALAASPDDVEVVMISVTYGNVEVHNCLRNVLAMFHIIEREMQWRREHGRPEGFEILKRTKPLVAVGADGPLGDQLRMADYFRSGKHPDCHVILADRYTQMASMVLAAFIAHQHLTPPETWKALFSGPLSTTLLTEAVETVGQADTVVSDPLFIPSQRASHWEILRLLDENPPDTITIIAIGPLTTIAQAASHAPQTVMRAKAVLVMGGAVAVPGNVTPLAEFNTYADSMAAARVFALTASNPSWTMPPPPPPPLPQADGNAAKPSLPPYPAASELGTRRLRLVLFPLDITTPHTLRRDDFLATIQQHEGSPLAEWTKAFLTFTFHKMEGSHGTAAMELHDLLCVWYAVSGEKERDGWSTREDEDIRVETAGQWTQGMCVVDRRSWAKRIVERGDDGEVVVDGGGWLKRGRGNRLARCVDTPGRDALGRLFLTTVFGP